MTLLKNELALRTYTVSLGHQPVDLNHAPETTVRQNEATASIGEIPKVNLTSRCLSPIPIEKTYKLQIMTDCSLAEISGFMVCKTPIETRL